MHLGKKAIGEFSVWPKSPVSIWKSARWSKFFWTSKSLLVGRQKELGALVGE